MKRIKAGLLLMLIMAQTLVSAIYDEPTAPDTFYQDAKTHQRLNMGMTFRQAGIMNTAVQTFSRTLTLPRPTLQELQPTVDPFCMDWSHRNDCLAVPLVEEARKLTQKTFQALNRDIDSFPTRTNINPNVTSLNNVSLPLFPRSLFVPDYPENATYPSVFEMNATNVFKPPSIQLSKLHKGSAIYKIISDSGSRLTATDQNLNAVMKNASQALQHIVASLEEYSYRVNSRVWNELLTAFHLISYREALQSLRSGVLTPFLVPTQEVNEVKEQLSYLLDIADMDSLTIRIRDVTAIRDDDNLYVTLNFEASKELDVLRVETFPFYIGPSSKNGTMQLKDVAPYMALSKDRKFLLEMTQEQFDICSGREAGLCSQTVAFKTTKDSDSCLWWLYSIDEDLAMKHCRWAASDDSLEPSAFFYADGWLRLTKVHNVTFVKDGVQGAEVKACPDFQCVLQVPCGYEVNADFMHFPPSFSGCREDSLPSDLLYPMNIPVAATSPRLHYLYKRMHMNIFSIRNSNSDYNVSGLENSPVVDVARFVDIEVKMRPLNYPPGGDLNEVVVPLFVLCILGAILFGVWLYFWHRRMTRILSQLRDPMMQVYFEQPVRMYELLRRDDLDFTKA